MSSIEIEDKVFIKSIENSLTVGSWAFNIETNTLDWSLVTKKIHEVKSNFTPNVSEGFNFYKEGIHRERIISLFNKAITKGEKFDDDFIIITSKGNEKWVRSIGYPIFKNKVCVGVRGVFQDITEKTLITKEIAIKEKQFRSIFQNSVAGMAIIGLKGEWLKVNKGICDILGYTEKEFLELSYIDLTHPNDVTIGKKEISLMLSGRLSNFQIEKRYIHKNGTIINCLLSFTIVIDLNKKPLHFIANITNISKIKRGEEKIKNLLDITSKQNDRLLNFAHIVSHNLRSHGGNLEMLLQLKKEEYPELIKNEYFPLIETAVENLNKTIHNLNEVSIHNSVNKNDLKTLNLLLYAKNAIGNINALILANNAKIELSIDKNINVKGVPAYLDSILINFLTNAIKYKKPTVAPIILINAIQEKEFVIIEITDDGLGIDLEKFKHKLFGMYNVFHKHKQSRGLGLFITKNQIDALGGKIEVESKVNKGTTFKIYLKHE